MGGTGYGTGAALAIGSESTPGVGADDVAFLPFLSEGIKGTRPNVKSGTITGDRSVYRRQKGVRSAAGDFSLDVDGANFGLPFYYWNGNASGAITSSAISGRQATAPTVVAASAGSLPDGVYGVACAAVFRRTIDGTLWLVPVSASANVTLGTGSNTITVTYGNAPSGLTPPAGYTYYGTATYRTVAGGSIYYLARFVVGTSTGTSLNGTTEGLLQDGTNGQDLTIPIPSNITCYKHVFKRAFVPGQNPLPAFSTVVLKDNDVSERYLLCRMNTFELTVSEGNNPVQAKFGLMARDFESIANPTPSLTHLQKFMSWQAVMSVDGVGEETLEAASITGTNNCELVPGLSGQPRMRDVGRGLREVTGTITRGFENHSFWNRMRGDCCAQKFDLQLYAGGQAIVLPTTAGCYCFDAGADHVDPWQYGMVVEAFQCSLAEAGANVGVEGRMLEQIAFETEVDATAGTELRLTLYNLTSSYA